MGCGNSTAKFNEKLAAVEIHGLKQSWDGIASAKFFGFGGPNVLKCRKVLTESSVKAKVGGQLLDGAGTVLLDIVPHGDKPPTTVPYCFNTPDIGHNGRALCKYKGWDRLYAQGVGVGHLDGGGCGANRPAA